MTSTDLHDPSTSAAPSSAVTVHDRGDGVLVLRVADGRGNVLGQALADELVRALDTARRGARVKVLVLQGDADVFLRGARAAFNESLELFRSIASFPVPVIAAMRGDAAGAGWFAAALCDLVILAESSTYGYTDPAGGLLPTPEEERLFAERFGRPQAKDLLYVSIAATGRELAAKGWSCAVMSGEEVDTHAYELAAKLASQPTESLRSLKAHFAETLVDRLGAICAIEPAAPTLSALESPHDEIASLAAPGAVIGFQAHEHVLLLTVGPDAAETCAAELAAVLGELGRDAAQTRTAFRAVVLASEHADFVPLPVEGSRAAVAALRDALDNSALPVIAALPPNATGRAWLIGELCDAAVYADEDRYGLADLVVDPAWSTLAADVLGPRLGRAAARAAVLAGASYAGADLRAGLGPVTVVPRARVIDRALELARSWTEWPAATWLARRAPRTAQEADAPASAAQEEPVAVETDERVVLASGVVTATADPRGILVVRMEDRASKNLFCDELVHGLRAVLELTDEMRHLKVVVLTGFDRYFASGGTKDALVAIQQGNAKFTDDATYRWALDCKLPVIAAMQGHAVGGGLSLGLFADFVLFGAESKYVSPYLRYGFTPGAGATLIVPDVLGLDLGRETLLTAYEYAGSELAMRASALAVCPRAEVLDRAIALAERIARAPRAALVALKARFNRALADELAETTERELAMHGETLVGRADTLARIDRSFDPIGDGASARADDASIESVPPAALRNGRDGAAVPAVPNAASDAPRTPAVRNTATGELAGVLRELLAEELHMRAGDIGDDTPFTDLGLDSITGVTWMRKVNERYGTDIPATKVYAHPTLTKLCSYVETQIGAVAPSGARPPAALEAADADAANIRASAAENIVVPRTLAPAISARPTPARALTAKPAGGSAPKARAKLASWRSREPSRRAAPRPDAAAFEPIAVIGMAGQFPKARTIGEYWDNIAHGRDCIAEIPKRRWDVDAYYRQGDVVPGKTNSRWMGALDEYDLFDPLFFDISPKEAISMDPQQRLFLQTSWHAIEHAGYDPRSLAGSRCGVFVGCGPGDYHMLSRDLQTSALGFTGGDTAILAARVSYLLDLLGPCLAIETACSSSLVAIATACDSLAAGNSDLALAGGVCVMTGPEVHVKMAQTGMLSPDGRCFTFDRRANGFVPGEGVGTLLLKRASDAERDGDAILGVIRGWGVNQDGKTNGITAPNPAAQTRLQCQVYDRHGIDPAGIGLIEAHGTGTKLGDPIEVDALKDAFGRYTRNSGYCALGSVKSNIGHCFTAAGAASAIKVLLALTHRQLPPTICFERINEHIRLDDSPFYVNDRLREWTVRDGEPRQAAINGFGFGGTNAHLVIAEPVPGVRISRRAGPTSVDGGKFIVPLSAKSAERLEHKASDLLGFIRAARADLELEDLAYTLQVGREAMDERACFLVASLAELADKLESWVGGARSVEGCYRGAVRDHREATSLLRRDADLRATVLDKLLEQRKVASLAELWTQGMPIDWQRLYGARKPRRIRLPLYPFAKERYWIAAAPAGEPAAPAAERAPAAPAASPVPRAESTAAQAPVSVEGMTRDLERKLKESLAGALFLPSADIPADKPFIELGLDSIVGVEWVNELNKQYDIKINATKVYDYPNVAELAKYIATEIGKSAPRPAPHDVAIAAPEASAMDLSFDEPPPARRAHDEPSAPRGRGAGAGKIAIVGMSGRYPQAADLSEFWRNLEASKDAVTEIPPARWDVARYYDPDPKNENKMYCKWMGVLDDIDCFDPLFFRISPAEAKNMDPQHRLFLQEAYRAFEHAGYSSRALSAKKCGVYVGIIGTEYASLVPTSADITGNNPAIGAARIAYFLNLKGPAISIDTACSASLVAIHLACQGLASGETDVALAGGVSVWLNPDTYIGMCRAGMLSPDGRCKTFDNAANGFVPGEGVGAVVLKRLEDAERDGDCVYGVILGSAINQDGKTNGITAPSVTSQAELERDLYARFDIHPESIGYVETHGTGTKLGDPIELEALATVFKERTAKKRFCGLGSVKSNIGHTSGAAGVASVHKVLLSLQHRTLVPSLNFTNANVLFDFDDSPFYVSQRTRPWEVADGAARRAAVSSFGFSGTNAHLVIEEHVRPPRPAGTVCDDELPFLLSARTPEQLLQRARDLATFLRHAPASLDPLSVAYTLLEGRDAMDERFGVAARSIAELGEKLAAFSDGLARDDLYRGRVEHDADGAIVLRGTADEHAVGGGLPARIEQWTQGHELRWGELRADRPPQRVGLPTYPFAKKRCWVDPAANVERVPTRAALPATTGHAAVRVAPSDGITLRAATPSLLDWSVANGAQDVLAAAAYLELALAAIERDTANTRRSASLALTNVAWGRPLAAASERRVGVALFPAGDRRVDFEIYSTGSDPDDEIVHCQGHAELRSAPLGTRLDTAALERRLQRVPAPPANAALESMVRGDGEWAARLHASANEDGTRLAPVALDALARAALASFDRAAPTSPLPFALDSVHVVSDSAPPRYASARTARAGTAGVVKLDLDVYDARGELLAELRGLAYECTAAATGVDDASPPRHHVVAPRPVVAPLGGERSPIGLVDLAPVAINAAGSRKPTQVELS